MRTSRVFAVIFSAAMLFAVAVIAVDTFRDFELQAAEAARSGLLKGVGGGHV